MEDKTRSVKISRRFVYDGNEADTIVLLTLILRMMHFRNGRFLRAEGNYYAYMSIKSHLFR